jgi:hypothetical protein
MDALLEFGRGIRQDPSRRQVTPWNPTSLSDSNACTNDWHGLVCSSCQILLMDWVCGECRLVGVCKDADGSELVAAELQIGSDLAPCIRV